METKNLLFRKTSTVITPFQSLNFFLLNANRPANLYDLELSAFNPVVDRAERNFKDPANVFFSFQFITSIDYNYTLLYVNCQQFSTKNPPVFIPAGLVTTMADLLHRRSGQSRHPL